jgi:DNA-binding CsgD family transcriptional regulator
MAILRGVPNLTARMSVPPQRRPQLLSEAQEKPLSDRSSISEAGPHHLLMAGFEALDLVNVGLLVTSAAGQLLLANRSAEQILDTRDGLELTPRGTIRTTLKSTPALNVLLDAAGKSQPSESNDSIVAIRRPSGKRPLTLVIRSVQAVAAPTADPSSPTALVFILDPEFPVETAESELRQLYGLTSTEACLANLLMEGKTLDECCESLGIRRSTARTHLQHLFEKVGVQRQSELVSLLLKSIGLVRTAGKRGKGRNISRTANDEPVLPR